jgi:alanine dehydrogenase
VIVGVPKEIKNNEYRVGMTPAGVEMLSKAGHTVFVQKTAGEGTGIADAEFEQAGATILGTADEVFEKADMIIKIKEPLDPEFPRLRKGQILFTYLHLAGDKELTQKTLETGCIGIAYETMEREDGSLPLLVPMSEVAGRLATLEGAKYMQRTYGGRGIFLGGVPGTDPAQECQQAARDRRNIPGPREDAQDDTLVHKGSCEECRPDYRQRACHGSQGPVAHYERHAQDDEKRRSDS